MDYTRPIIIVSMCRHVHELIQRARVEDKVLFTIY